MPNMLDHLIEWGKIPAGADTEYLYSLDMIWKRGTLRSFSCPRYMIVHNVSQVENGSYDFMAKKTGEHFMCNYPWAFVLNNPDNKKALKKYFAADKILDKWKRKCKDLHNKIDTLQFDSKKK